MPFDPISFGLSAGGNNSWSGGGGPYRFPGVDYSGVKKPSGVSSTPTGAAAEGTKFDLGQSKELGQLSDIINSINLSAQKSALQARVPNNPALEAQSSANIGSELKGQVPADVLAQLQRQAAERGVATGVGTDSANANAAYLRALGLTSLNLQEQGQRDLSAADARNPAAPIFDPTTMLLTPAQTSAQNLGYMSEADRVALEQERLALEAARGGGGGRGGYGYTGNTGGGSNPYQYVEPGMYAGGMTSTGTTGLTGSSVMPYTPPSTADWLASIGYNPNYMTGADAEAGVRTSPTDYASLFPGVDYSTGE